jgi:hypothetical protein
MTGTHTLKMMDDTEVELKCAHINLKHSRVATANLMKYTADNKVDIICIQKPYINHGRAVGIDTQYKTFTAGEARSRAAIIITNRKVDATLITQLSEEGTITLEITSGDNYSSKQVLRQTKTPRTRSDQS